MKNILLYAHGGSGNHGCEALAKTIHSFLPYNYNKILCTFNKKEDDYYKTTNLFDCVIEQTSFPKGSLRYYIDGVQRKIFKSKGIALNQTFKILKNKMSKGDYAISIGGDNYCYKNTQWLEKYNSFFQENKIKTILLGCSIEPSILKKENIINDLKKYSVIIARESITYNALKEAKIKNIYLIPDPAFTLEKRECKLPDKFLENNTVGINISPLIESCENRPNVTFKNYVKLIEKLIENTEMQIALIPHVIWEKDNDLKVLKKLYEMFKNTNRVMLIQDKGCEELKYIISKCRFMIAARTHASIAAYSSFVPTLVIGYSVKAEGIAKDIFGEAYHYVLPVQKLAGEEDLFDAFKWLFKHENKITKKLYNVVPVYIQEANNTTALFKEIFINDK